MEPGSEALYLENNPKVCDELLPETEPKLLLLIAVVQLSLHAALAAGADYLISGSPRAKP